MTGPVPIAVLEWRMKLAAHQYASQCPSMSAEKLTEIWCAQLRATVGSAIDDTVSVVLSQPAIPAQCSLPL